MSLFFSSDGRSFHTDGADERKLRRPKRTVHERGTTVVQASVLWNRPDFELQNQNSSKIEIKFATVDKGNLAMIRSVKAGVKYII